MKRNLSEDLLTSLNRFTEVPVDQDLYREMDYFLPSKSLNTVFTHEHGSTEKNIKDFTRVFPCPEESLREEINKRLERDKSKERQKLPIPMQDKESSDQLHSEKSQRLTETLSNCSETNCPWRITGVKYDLISCIMEHSNNCLIEVGQEIAKFKRNCMEMELQNIHFLPTTGTMKDLKERVARARQKRWPPPNQPLPSRNEAPKSEGLTEDSCFFHQS